MVGQGKERTLQESDSVENMEESCEDSDFLELVSQGQESHPLVRFTRLAQTKKAELEYHYNPVGGRPSQPPVISTVCYCRTWTGIKGRT